MGLDMFLEARRVLWVFDDGTGKDADAAAAIAAALPEMGYLRPQSVTVEAAYWRKANAIHKWFVDNCQNGRDECQHTYVERTKLQELLDLVNRVLDNPVSAAELLPAQSGFFFGSTDYDEWYMQDLRYTKARLEMLLSNEQLRSWVFYYHSSW